MGTPWRLHRTFIWSHVRQLLTLHCLHKPASMGVTHGPHERSLEMNACVPCP